ncbi:MAG: tetratricopeptide repeat protein [Candidatus Eisenbacteria bacterium]|uniref:Tetratricopeptide repeat protein n=1 Tax=Eiseniibacteriota bacterium TaxID=2212470 RepID=A0A538U7Y9_UNCEI|nr:MAG: tetratricopeptide repeat protein [Candidatus Eisenbacteria bacterium]
MPSYDKVRISNLEQRLAVGPDGEPFGHPEELELLADLYIQADTYTPALETIQRLLTLPGAHALSASRRAALELKAVACRLAQGDSLGALGQCRELLVRESDIDSGAVRAALHLRCADALQRLGRLADARAHGGRALRAADEAGDLGVSARSLHMLGVIAYRLGELSNARDLYEQALALYRRVGEEASAARLRNDLGLIHKNLCEWDAASAHFRAALESLRGMGRYAETGLPLLNLGIVHQKCGEWPQALEHYREAERVFRQVADPLGLARVTIGLGNLARLQRRFTDAERAFGEALEGARAQSARREEVLALEFLGELEFDRERPEAALTRYAEALALAERVAPEGDLVLELERRRAEALGALGRLEEGERSLERALRIARACDDRLEFAVCHRVAGSLAMAAGRREAGIERWKEAVRLLTDCRERFELGKTCLALGRVTLESVEARRHLYRASVLFADLDAPHWMELAEQSLQHANDAPAGGAPAPPGSVLGRRHRAPSLVTCSHAMQRVETLARRAAATELSVLITGETGTGKELIARTIHNLSARAERPFLAVNCGALRADLALSQLFGHRKGAFTGAHTDGVGLVEAAHGGTLFLDEIGELPADVQVTLLRFLESGEYFRLGETQVRRADVRMITATNRELYGLDGERGFRRDLVFRLDEIGIRLPPLRERPDDILPLARHFLDFYGGMDGPRLTREAESVLRSYPWPGNVRELENVMKRVAALHRADDTLDAEALLPFLSRATEARLGPRRPDDERAAIETAWKDAGGNKSRLALMLGVSRKTLYARLKRLGLQLQ